MNSYKITNITNQANKRDNIYNTIVEIEYIDNILKKKISVKPGECIYLTLHKLPMSVNKLLIKNLISVTEVTNNELNNAINDSKKTEVIDTPKKEEPFKKKNVKKETELK